MYSQILRIGEGQIPCRIEYTTDEEYCIVERVLSPKGEDIMGCLDWKQVEAIGERLEAGHGAVLDDMWGDYDYEGRTDDMGLLV